VQDRLGRADDAQLIQFGELRCVGEASPRVVVFDQIENRGVKLESLEGGEGVIEEAEAVVDPHAHDPAGDLRQDLAQVRAGRLRDADVQWEPAGARENHLVELEL